MSPKVIDPSARTESNRLAWSGFMVMLMSSLPLRTASVRDHKQTQPEERWLPGPSATIFRLCFYFAANARLFAASSMSDATAFGCDTYIA